MDTLRQQVEQHCSATAISVAGAADVVAAASAGSRLLARDR